ncbi:hypothetical protein QQ008_27730 [Fulvivirgaceae bacterium BMA10]|uniref:Capsule assembly Wzi family protein n=1 Tax=Splendidivirga corallicola TaxID=3051826 RepID=A0ABT8KWM1_9BACT|nr:hypothetical protein [Fulvivirgaceae bacterium BMA10]
MKKGSLVFIVILGFTCNVFSQSANAPLNKFYYHLLDRYEIKSGKVSESFHSSSKPYDRKAIAAFVDSIRLSEDTVFLNPTDRYNLQYLANDNWEWSQTAKNNSKKPFLKKLYRNQSDLYHVNTEHFDLHVNPVLYLSGGFDKDEDSTPYTNTRGVQIRGSVDKKVGFYTFLGENQTRFPAYARDWVVDPIAERYSIPGEGFWKSIEGNAYDFFSARGYINVNATKHIQVQLGFDKNSIGNGHRSLILSDFANSYAFMKITTRVWKLNYTNIFAEMKANHRASPGGSRSDRQYPNKFMAFHHLSLNITKNFNVGIFEAVSFAENDTTRATVPFNLNYLNPIIFFRAIEQNEGSPHNAILGADFKWNLWEKFSLYGQIVLDEFKLDNVTAGNGWWANKFAYQFGVKYIDVFNIPNLDVQLETNIVRPYTYSHFTQRTNFSHYNLPLAHPLGANFNEYIGIMRFQPMKKLWFTGTLMYSEYGEDINTTSNYGGNVRLNSNSRFDGQGNRLDDFGNEIGQGVNTQLLYGDFTVSFHWKHNLFFDLQGVLRRLDSDIDDRDKNSIFGSFSLRWNIPQRALEF